MFKGIYSHFPPSPSRIVPRHRPLEIASLYAARTPFKIKDHNTSNLTAGSRLSSDAEFRSTVGSAWFDPRRARTIGTSRQQTANTDTANSWCCSRPFQKSIRRGEEDHSARARPLLSPTTVLLYLLYLMYLLYHCTWTSPIVPIVQVLLREELLRHRLAHRQRLA